MYAIINDTLNYSAIKALLSERYGEPHYILKNDQTTSFAPKILSARGREAFGWVFGKKLISISKVGQPENSRLKMPDFIEIEYHDIEISEKEDKIRNEKEDIKYKKEKEKALKDL